MWDEYLVSRLSSKASQVLLSLLLTRQIEVQRTSAEFAKTTGLGQRSIAPALLELKEAGLIKIITQPGKPSLVRLVHPEEYRYETTVTEDGGPVLERMDQAKLSDHKHIDGETDGKAEGVAEEGVGRVENDVSITEASPEAVGPVAEPALLAGGSPGTGHPTANSGDGKGAREAATEANLIEQCRVADDGQDRGLRIAALQDVWDYAFPYDDYPLQRLTNDTAKRLLVNRSAEWVGQVILDSVTHATSRIQSPRGYIEKAVANEERRKGPGQGSGPVISDDLRRLAQLGKEQFGAKDQERTGDLE